MRLQIKKSGGVGFARKLPYEYEGIKYEADLQNGDEIKILDSGQVEPGQFGEQHNFKIKTRNGDKKLSFNQSSINVLVEEFGEDTENWIGKDVKVILKKGTYAGKKGIATYVVVDGWQLDEYGELVKDGQNGQNDNSDNPGDEIDEEIPF